MAELEESDFEDDDSMSPSEIFRQPPPAHINYVIQMAQLAKLCKKIADYEMLEEFH